MWASVKSFAIHIGLMLALVVFLILRAVVILGYMAAGKPWRREQ